MYAAPSAPGTSSSVPAWPRMNAGEGVGFKTQKIKHAFSVRI